MGEIKDGFASTFRAFVTDGVPASGVNKPSKAEASALGSTIELQVAAAAAAVSGDGIEAIVAAVQPLVDEAQAAQASAEQAAAKSKDLNFPVTMTLGSTAGPGANNVAGNGTYGFGSHFLQRAILVGAEIWTQGAGAIALRRAALTADADIHTAVRSLLNFTVSSGGQHILTEADILAANGGQPFIMQPGELLAGGSSGGLLFDGSYEPYWSFPNGLGEGASAALNLGDQGATFKAKFTFQFAPRVPEHIPLRRYDRFSQVPASWLNQAGKASPDGNGALDLAVANFTQQLICPATIGLDRHSVEWEVSANTTATEIAFLTNPTTPVDSGQFEGSMITLRWGTASGQLCVYQRWDGNRAGTNAPGPLDPADLFPVRGLDGGPFLVPNRRYRVRMTQLYRDYLVEVIAADGPGYYSKLVSDHQWDSYKARAPQDSDKGNTHTLYGLMHGSPSIVSLGAGAKLYSFRIDHDYADEPLMLSVGDSIKAGFGVLAGERCADLLEQDYGRLLVPTSGVGGATSIGMVARLFFLLKMRPKFVLLAFGTNGGDDAVYAANLALAVRMVREAGATPIFETVPISAARSTTIKALGVQVIEVAGATRQSGAGSAAVTDFYALIRPDDLAVVSDGFHGNALYHQRQRAQIKRDLGI